MHLPFMLWLTAFFLTINILPGVSGASLPASRHTLERRDLAVAKIGHGLPNVDTCDENADSVSIQLQPGKKKLECQAFHRPGYTNIWVNWGSGHLTGGNGPLKYMIHLYKTMDDCKKKPPVVATLTVVRLDGGGTFCQGNSGLSPEDWGAEWLAVKGEWA